ncbi:glycosyltransferase family 4 protein [Desulfogranum mediterraneum]|uniref:glycosyltransferase family 4 protein n=1 Tax=Desulfogranum mediterraneum TaxID=160661 RepID=UPI000412E9A5|nr:glycosyltransferase family 1 protein [Desulfogranum mediterraneum]
MNICIASDAWHPQINGVVTTLGKTIATLESWGHQVRVLCPGQYPTVPCPTYPEIRLALVSAHTIRRVLEQHRPDAVHIVTEGPIGRAARRACLQLGRPFTSSYHTRFPEYIRLRLPIPLALSYWYVRRFHAGAVRTMAAPTLLDELQERHFSNLVPWSRGVDTALFRPRQKKQGDQPGPILLYLGRVAVEKNLPAFLDLDLAGTKYVVGAGPALASYQRDYPEVRFTGVQQGESLARLLAAADVFVFPSLTDTFGVVLLEAMACGVPVAAFPVTGPRHIVKNGFNGVVDQDLAKAVHGALKVAPEGCLATAREYSWEACTRQFCSNLALA